MGWGWSVTTPAESARVPHQLHAVFEPGQVARGNFWAEHRNGMGVECDHASRKRPRPGLVAEPPDQRLVAEVDAIQHADCERGLGSRGSRAELGGGK
jgi:hypothetical protein